MDYIKWYRDTPVGDLMLASDGEKLTGLWLGETHRYFAHTLSEERAEKNLKIFDQAAEWLDIYFQGKDPGPIPPVNPQVTPFRRAVCEVMAEIPYGQTTTYGAIAHELERRLGKPKVSARAVGGGVGHNPVSIIIPCHRVVGASGSLTGYGGGIMRKVALMELEGIDMSQFTIPAKGTAL